MRWRTTEQILSGGEEYWDENWLDRPAPMIVPTKPSGGPLRTEDVDLWEVIVQNSGGVGVYAAWLPYGEHYIVTGPTGIVAEFTGQGANAHLERYLIAHGIRYPKG